MRESTEPDARAVADLRNHLEHKYAKVHELGPYSFGSDDPFRDTLAFSINRTEFERRTLRLLMLVRAALIYLSLAMHREEQKREAGKGEGGLIMPMRLDPLEDGWKR